MADNEQAVLTAEQADELGIFDGQRRYVALAARGLGPPYVAADAEPLTAAEHLEVLALGESLARYYGHPSHVHYAVRAGASWPQVAAARGVPQDQAERDYRQWAEEQHQLWLDGRRFGLDDDEYEAAIVRCGTGSDQPAARRLCAHADQDGRGMHWLEPGETCPAARRAGA